VSCPPGYADCQLGGFPDALDEQAVSEHRAPGRDGVWGRGRGRYSVPFSIVLIMIPMLRNCLSKWVEEGEGVKYRPMKASEYVLERVRATRALEKEEVKGEGEEGELDAWIVGSQGGLMDRG
jgi:hypothetical protein